jgi:hypothetical protein
MSVSMNDLGLPDMTRDACSHAITCCKQSDYRVVEAMLRADGYQTIAFHGSAVRDRASLFSQAAIDLPQPETQIARSSFDELSSNIRDCLLENGSTKVAILWSNAHVLLDANIQTFMDASVLFATLQRDLSSAVSYPWIAIDLQVVAFGTTANFCGRGFDFK